jgi:TonB family protein
MNTEIFDHGRFVSGIAHTADGDYPYAELETQAEFKGGLPALGKFILQSLRYPREARKRKAEGQAFVSFIIEKDGSLSDVKSVKDLDEALDAEARRVVLATNGKWSPGRQRGHPIRSRFVLPIKFNLN